MPPRFDMLVVLDLDETLVFATEDPLERPADFIAGPFHVYKRPGVDHFLETCGQWFRVVVVGSIMLLVEAFSAGVLWGLACFFLPIVQLFFLVTHWHNAKKAFYVQLAGYALVVFGVMMSPDNRVPTGPLKARPPVGWPTPR